MAFITSHLSGGIGNQLFQIAAGYCMAKYLGVPYRVSLQHYYGAGQGNGPPLYASSVYSKLNFEQSMNYDYLLHEYSWHYNPVIDELRSHIRGGTRVCLEGHYQSDKYFMGLSSNVRNLFTPEGGFKQWLLANTDMAVHMPELFEEGHGYCFIGVRRGDYMKQADFHNPCGMTYYTKAIGMLPAQRYYIASDDIEWCKKKFIGPQYRFFEIGISNDIVQLALMTLFQKYIMSNSTYYWWGSFLSSETDIQVIAPDKWIFGPHAERSTYDSIYRDDMLVIERPVEID